MSLMKPFYFLTFIFIMLITGCAKPTGYAVRENYWDGKYGCNDKKISEDEFAIISKGNKLSTPDHVAKLALYHAANVTLKNGKSSFHILKKDSANLPNHQITVIPIPILGAPILFLPVAENTVNETTSILIIKLCLKSTAINTECISADKIIKELKPIVDNSSNTSSI